MYKETEITNLPYMVHNSGCEGFIKPNGKAAILIVGGAKSGECTDNVFEYDVESDSYMLK